ncbi:Uncharacterised protein [Bordetella pertussis]|nr:Uncharacterised protein [Bordetella pertussis]
MIGREIQAADVGQRAIDGDDLAVQAAKQIGAHAQQARARIEYMEPHAQFDQAGDEVRRQAVRAIAVDRDVDAHAAPRRRHQRLAQFAPDRVVEQDEGLDEDFLAGLADGCVDPREIAGAILENGEAVAVAPGRAHNVTSAASGTWSDSRDHGRRLRRRGSDPATLRT